MALNTPEIKMTWDRWEKMTDAARRLWRSEHGTNPQDLPDGSLDRWRREQTRVELQFRDGRKERGTIAQSTGWAPCWVLVKTRRSRGGHGFDASDIVRGTPVGWLRRRALPVPTYNPVTQEYRWIFEYDAYGQPSFWTSLDGTTGVRTASDTTTTITLFPGENMLRVYKDWKAVT